MFDLEEVKIINQNQNRAKENIASSIVLDILVSDFKFPPMPANGAKLMTMVQKPVDDIDIPLFVKLIESDPGLFSMVLQLANSIYYRERNEILSLRPAIVRVGLQEIVNCVNLYFFKRMFSKIPVIPGFSADNYWAFSWACATAARRLGHPNIGMNALAGELYLGGLLHGIGKLILAIHHTREFSKCLRLASESGRPLYEVELEQFGTTDAHVASRLMNVWDIPYRICQGVKFCHNPEAAPKETKELAALIQFAYYIASLSRIGSNGDGAMVNLESIWISGQPDLSLLKNNTQERIINETLRTLTERSESVTGVMPQPEEQALIPKKPGEKNNHPPEKTSSLSKRNRFWGWIKSLLS